MKAGTSHAGRTPLSAATGTGASRRSGETAAPKGADASDAGDIRLVIGVVEDNDDLRESIVELLETQGHRVIGLTCAEELSELNHGVGFELMVIDLNLPGEDGLSLSVRLKRAQPLLRVLMMTTRALVSDRVRGYESGADLYLPKPVAEDELLAAIGALARQVRAQAGLSSPDPAVLLRLDVKSLRLYGPQGGSSLNRREFVLLTAFSTAPGLRLEYWQLIEILGLSTEGGGKANVAVAMTRLRAKLDHVGAGHEAIKSLRSEGYQLCVPVQIG